MTTEEIWQSQALDAPRITPDYLRVRAHDSERAARRRNLREYISNAFGIAAMVFVLMTVKVAAWTQVGIALMIVSIGLYTWRWSRLASPATTPEDLGAMDMLRFHRRELERQREVWRRKWRWSLPLLVPSMVLMIIGKHVGQMSMGWATLIFQLLPVLVCCAIAIGVCEFRASRLRREIETLDLLVN